MTFASPEVLPEFLPDRDPVAWTTSAGFPVPLSPLGVFAQDAPNGLEVALVQSAKKPLAADLRTAWSKRKGNRASPVLLIAVYPTGMGNQAALVRSGGNARGLPRGRTSPSRKTCGNRTQRTKSPPGYPHAVSGASRAWFGSAGISQHGASCHPGTEGGSASTNRLERSRRDQPNPFCHFVAAVSWNGWALRSRRCPPTPSILTIDGRRQALAVFCDDTELMDAPARRFDNLSPVSHALGNRRQRERAVGRTHPRL